MSDFLVQKSNENIKAAKLLIDKQMYTASIHCSYYACYQLINFILFNNFKFTKEKLNKEQQHVAAMNKDHNSSDLNMNSHDATIGLFTEIIVEKNKFTSVDATKLQYNMSLLKTQRTQADYENETLTTPTIAGLIYNTADTLINNLKTKFNLKTS